MFCSLWTNLLQTWTRGTEARELRLKWEILILLYVCSFLNPNSCILSENLMPLQIHSSSENTESLNKKCTWNEDDFRHKHFTVSSTVRMEAASWASFTQTARKTNLKQRISLFWKRKIPEMWLNIFKIWTWLSSGLWVLVIQTQSSRSWLGLK